MIEISPVCYSHIIMLMILHCSQDFFVKVSFLPLRKGTLVGNSEVTWLNEIFKQCIILQIQDSVQLLGIQDNNCELRQTCTLIIECKSRFPGIFVVVHIWIVERYAPDMSVQIIIYGSYPDSGMGLQFLHTTSISFLLSRISRCQTVSYFYFQAFNYMPLFMSYINVLGSSPQ